MTTCAPLLHLSVEVNSIKWCQEALTEHLSVYPVSVFLLFPAMSAEKLDKTSWHCQMLHGTNQKRMVSPVWRRKYCLRNQECFCGRALNKCRNKFHAADPTPGAYSWRRRAEIVPAPLLACVEPGQGEHSTQCGVPEAVTVPCSPCDKGSSHSVMFGL